mgnify:CR=1 FL=1
MKKIISLFIISLLLIVQTQAQTTSIQNQLKPLIDTALNNNLLLKVARNKTEISELEVELFSKTFLPEIGVFVSAEYWSWLLPNKERILGGGNTDVYSTIYLKQMVYDGGQNKIKKEIAHNTILLNEQNIRKVKQTVVYAVFYTWLEILKAQKNISVYKNSIQRLNNHLINTQELYKINKATNLDILKVKVQITEEEKLLHNAQGILEDKKNELQRQLNSNFQPDIVDIDTLIEWNDIKNIEFNIETIMSSVIENHPDFLNYNLQIENILKQKLLIKAQNKPTVYSYANTLWEDKYIPFSNNFNYNVGIAISYRFPILKGSAYKIELLQNQKEIEQVQNTQNNLYIQIKSDITKALIQLENKKTEIEQTDKIIEMSMEVIQNETIKYNAAQGDIINILDANTILLNAQLSKYKLITEYLQLIALINFYSGINDNSF